MTIRTKLIFLFGIMLATVFAAAGASIWTFTQWQSAATELVSTRERSLEAERLRAAMMREVSLGIDYLGGDEITSADFERVQGQIEGFFATHQQFTEVAERDHAVGLRQTHDELEWIIEDIRRSAPQSMLNEDRDKSRRRLREIADEVTDDVAALNQYYRGKVDVAVGAASNAADLATMTIGVAVLVALLQLIALGVLMQRWLIKPIAEFKQATVAISRGNLDTQIATTKRDEWGELAVAVNEMTRSLKALQLELATKERFAALGELGAYTAHNIRNPLAGIRAAIQVLHSEVPETNTDMRDTMAEIITAVDRLDGWVKGFLEFARPLELNRDTADINQQVRNALEIVQGKYSGNGVAIVTNLAEPLPVTNIDKVLFEQAVAALVTNACESGGDTVTIATSSRQLDDGQRVVKIGVSDNGKGISEAMRAKLFRVFATEKRGGTGLGLAQAKKIVDLHGGSLSLVDSSPAGSAFEIELPLAGAQASCGGLTAH